MSTITRTYTFTDGTTAYGSQVESEISNIVTTWNNHDAGSSQWTTLSVSGNGSIGGTLAVTGASTLTGAVTASANFLALFFGYRKPNLTFVSVTTVDVENNTGTLNQTTIIFPDGSIRSVTEDTSSTNKYRRFLITVPAEFTSGTEDSGLRSGITEATNTWYAIYAVKSTINSANFVLAGDTTLPLQTNYATLNSRYGTSGWVYLGMIRNGDNSGATGDILNFTQSGQQISFTNVLTTTVTANRGLLLASTIGAANLTYTYSAGTGTTDIPNQIKIGSFSATEAGDTGLQVTNSAATIYYHDMSGISSNATVGFIAHVSGGVKITLTSAAQTIALTGLIDPLLSGSIGPTL